MDAFADVDTDTDVDTDADRSVSYIRGGHSMYNKNRKYHFLTTIKPLNEGPFLQETARHARLLPFCWLVIK